MNECMCVFTFVYMCLHIYLCTSCASSAHRSQMRALPTMEQELQAIGSCHVSVGTQSPSPGRAASAGNCRAISLALGLDFENPPF